MSRRVRSGIVSAVCALLAAFGQQSSSVADPYGNNHGFFASPGNTNLTGVRAYSDILDINAPRQCLFQNPEAGYTLGTLCSQIGGGNLRPLQIVATEPPSAVNRGEFIATGWGAGCFDHSAYGRLCSGVEGSSNSHRERQYVDGTVDFYHFLWYADVDPGQLPEFRIQRGASHGCYLYAICYFWQTYNGSSLTVEIGNHLMTKGFGVFGSETEPGANTIGTLKDSTWLFMQKRVTSWSDVNGATEIEPHESVCSVSTGYGGTWGGYYADGDGAC